MASTSGCQLAYSLKTAENVSTSSGQLGERSGNKAPRNGFGRSQSFANLQAAKKSANEMTRCESYAGRSSGYQTFDSFMSRHLLHPSTRISKPPSNDSDLSLKRVQSCPDLSDAESEVEYEIKCEDGECDIVFKSHSTNEEQTQNGHKNGDSQMPSRRITRLFSRSASITQALANNGRLVSSSIIQAAKPAFRNSFVNGLTGIVMAFFLAAASVLTALNSIHNHRFSGSKDCHKCQGGGAEKCKICQGKGGILWEGKLFHYDPCPACFGSGVVQCSHCKPRRFKGVGYTPAGLGLGIESA